MARLPHVALAAAWLIAAASLRAADERWLHWLNPALRQLEVERAALADELEALGVPSVGQTVAEYGYQHPRVSSAPDSPAWVQIDLTKRQAIDTLVLIPAQSDWHPYDRSAHGFPRRLRIELSDTADFARAIPLWSCTDEDFPDPGMRPVVIPAHRQKARFVRITVTKFAREHGRYFYALGEVMVLAGNLNVAIGRPILSSLRGPNLSWRHSNLVDGRTPLGPPIRAEPVRRDGFRIYPERGTQPHVTFDLGRNHLLQQVILHPIHGRNLVTTPGMAFPLGFRVEAAMTADFGDAVLLYQRSEYPNPGNNPVTLNGKSATARYVRVIVTDMKDEFVGWSEIEIYADGRNVARQAGITATPDRADRPLRWPESLLNDGFASYGRLLQLPEWLREWERRRELKEALAQNEQRRAVAVSHAHQRAWWLAAGGALAGAIVASGLLVASRLKRQREVADLRARLARDLHDEIGSNLAGLVVLSQVARHEEPPDSPQQENWAEVQRIARDSVAAMREVLWLVGGREEAGADLLSHLRLAASRLLAGRDVQWQCAVETLPAAWPMDARRHVFLFFKEALTNIVRHSHATRIAIAVAQEGDTLVLDIADNGAGFDPTQPVSGLGLANQRQRAAALGAELTVESAVQHGTRLRLSIPLPAVARAIPLARRLSASPP